MRPTIKELRGHSVYSQDGEDGILEFVFERIGTINRTAIEFGAWDGFHMSNTANLWKNAGWRGVLIECDQHKYAELVKKTQGLDVVPICRMVGTGDNSLEKILVDACLLAEADLLSIDIDGDDYHVLASLEMRPRVIVVEHNPTIPWFADVHAPRGHRFGASIGAMVRIAGEKGYVLVACTSTNCVFVLRELSDLFMDVETSVERIAPKQWLTFLVTDYNGRSILVGENPEGGLPYGLNGPVDHPVVPGTGTKIIPARVALVK